MDDQTKAMAEVCNMEFASQWPQSAGMDLTVEGVSLASAIEYDLLRVLGSIWTMPPAEMIEQAVEHA